MLNRIGILLPRSTDYPAMGFDILDGLRASLNNQGIENLQIFTENIGFGADAAINYSKAEKLILQDQVELIIAYCSSANAESLYQLADALNKPFIILDACMQLPETVSENSYHISLQGIHACRIAGKMAGSGNQKVLLATSFYDGGYRGPWGYDRGLSESGGAICANYVSGYKLAEFTIDPYIGLLQQSGATSVAACFSTYLAELFFKALNEKKEEAVLLPFYCSPFMAEEQMLEKCDFPGGEFYTVVPWASTLENEEQKVFSNCLGEKKRPNLFHLLGWEAGILAVQISEEGISSLKGFSYSSPRGRVSIHPVTHYSYAPLYQGRIRGNESGKCRLEITSVIEIDGEEHITMMEDRPEEMVSGWKNNYLCI